MDNLENTTPVGSDNVAELQKQVDSLRQTLASVLVIVFILAGAFNIYLLRQYRAVNSELEPLKKQSAQITTEMTKVNGLANEFVRRLIDFGKANPDFMPILHKYNIREMPATNAPAAATTAPARK